MAAGTPDWANRGQDSEQAHVALTRQTLVNLHDQWIRVSGKGVATLTMTVADPTAEFPATGTHTYLYQCRLNLDNDVALIQIPDIIGLVITAGLNILININCQLGNNATIRVSGHCLTILDA